MIELKDGMLLFHGSYTAIPDINLAACNRGLDFGQGFYLTSSYEQACSYVPLAVKKAKRLGRLSADCAIEDCQVSIFKFHYDPNRLEAQFCFRTMDAVKSLEFIRGDRYGDIKK